MNIAINDQTGILYTEDKIRYSKKEQEILKEFEYQIPLEVHLIKKLFGGTILKNAALVGTMFIPGGVGATIIGLNVAMQSVGLLATIGKLFVGNDNETLNNI